MLGDIGYSLALFGLYGLLGRLAYRRPGMLPAASQRTT
jgi:hypothetical protein